ncbi:hypothetical protein [Mucilaginibacter boryungensis]|uniref:Uncharacterized protein n=1 Tax=Mucilaginibacter boryungensis TaxID=768480 RepID=A0ABR9XFF6_9SPHI|nr:hypothetical protein [Mucilaginibacter boryungensis]MBE9665951.1 hypothetical protein [Mucilaginibacter boryungensis]
MKYIIHPTAEEEKKLMAFLEAENIIYYTEELPDFMLHELKNQEDIKAKNSAVLGDLKKKLKGAEDDE